MAAGKITKRAVDAIACPSSASIHFLWDNELRGFGVAVLPSGTKTFYCQTKAHGRSQRFKIGIYGRMTVEQARSAALKFLGAIEGGADPAAERRAARAVRSFREVADAWMAEHVEKKRKAGTQREYRRLLDTHILPAIGAMRVADVARRDVNRLHAAMSGSPFQANRCLAIISAIWTWASKLDEVLVANNPAKGIERNAEGARERYLTSAELVRLGEVLREAETIGLAWEIDETKPGAKHLPKSGNRRTKIDLYAAAAIRLLILTGMRLREVLTLEWSHVDFDRGALFLPDSKTGRKTVILGAPALVILAGLPRVERCPFVIKGQKLDKARADLGKPWTAVRRAAGLDNVRLHDLRHSFASVGAGASLGLPTIGKLLGHTQASTTQRYAHIANDPLRRAADTISEMIFAQMAGTTSSALSPDGNAHSGDKALPALTG